MHAFFWSAAEDALSRVALSTEMALSRNEDFFFLNGVSGTKVSFHNSELQVNKGP